MLPKPTPFEPNPFRPGESTVRYRRRPAAPAAKGAAAPSVNGDSAPAPTKQDLPARRGPPVVFDEEKRLLFCELVRHGFTKGKAARLLKLAPRTVQEAAQNDPEFAEWISEAVLELHAHSAANIARAGRQNWRAAAWLLDRVRLRRGPGRPRTRSLLLTDPLLRGDLKQLVREVLLEVMPASGREMIAPPASIPPSPSASPHLQCASAQTKARQFPDNISASASQLPLPQTLAPPHANGHARITAQNP